MDGRLWNLGVKVVDLDREVRFLQDLGAKIIYPAEARTAHGRSFRVALTEVCGTRVLLTTLPVFEAALPRLPDTGLTHAVFEVSDLDAECPKVLAAGAQELMPRELFTGTVGTRKTAFFRSPNGLVFEVMQIMESRV